jgi:hypothetical protein
MTFPDAVRYLLSILFEFIPMTFMFFGSSQMSTIMLTFFLNMRVYFNRYRIVQHELRFVKCQRVFMTMNDFLSYLEIRYYSNLPGTAKLIIKFLSF